MATTLRRLRLKRISLVDTPANEAARVVLFKSAAEKAEWTAAFVNDLPDSSFAYISPGGEKDEDGRTKPRSLRHLPYKDADGKIDLPHLRNALARLSQTDIPADAKAAAAKKLRAAAEAAGVGKEETSKMQPTGDQVDVPAFARCKKCDAEMQKGETKCSKCGDEMPLEGDATKAASRPEEDKVDEKLKADLEAAQAQVEALTKERDDLLKRLETPDEIEKRKLAALPESVRKQLTEQAEEIAKMRSEKSEAEQIEKAKKDMPNVPGKADDLGRLLKRVKDVVKAEDFEALTTILKAASAQIEKGGLFREAGRPGDGVTESVQEEVMRLAGEHIAKSKDMKLEDAYAVVFRERPELYAAYARSVSVGANADRD